MTQPVSLSLTAEQHEELRKALYPGDGRESVAFALCSRRAGNRRHRLLVQEVHEMPCIGYSVRAENKVIWSTDPLVPLLEKAQQLKLSLIKMHSHPNGYPAFSDIDDKGDAALLGMISAWVECDIPHGSVIMLPDGKMFGRVFAPTESNFSPIHAINVVGDNLVFWYPENATKSNHNFVASHQQAFGRGTVERLGLISVAVIGCSGTGSPLIEQLARLGIGEIVLVDDDRVEDRNVNRMLNSTMDDADHKRPKVEVLADAVKRMKLGTRIIPLQGNLWDRKIAGRVAECDVVFGCMDTVDGRYLLNKLASFYLIPQFNEEVHHQAGGYAWWLCAEGISN